METSFKSTISLNASESVRLALRRSIENVLAADAHRYGEAPEAFSKSGFSRSRGIITVGASLEVTDDDLRTIAARLSS